MFEQLFRNVRQNRPLVHCITNYVTVNDCANMLLACGSSPIMADDPEDAVEITAICDALYINLGTLNSRTIPAMFAAGARANTLGHPVVLDPVGAGASPLRTNTALDLLTEVKFAVIRGNMSEIRALGGQRGTTNGVDVDTADVVTPDSLDAAVRFAERVARSIGAVIAVTGATDIVTDGERAFLVHNGRPEMASVTGTGCQLSALSAAFVCANPDLPLEAAAGAVCAMGLCGEIAHARMSDLDGNASYRNYIIDAMYRLSPEDLERGSKHDEIQ